MKDVHYGPVWDGKRYGSLCGASPVLMGTDRRMVECPACIAKLAGQTVEEHPADWCERHGVTLD